MGKNGFGKSAILDAITFSLFGKAFRNINKGNLVNSINTKDCLVEINFSTNGKKYRVIRGIKPTVFQIYCDDLLINQDAASRDYQEYLENNILKMTFKSFTQIVILGSASFTPFMQLTPADRRLVIEDLLDIQIFTVMNTIVKSRLLKNKEDIASNTVEIRSITQNKEFIVKTINGLKDTDKENLRSLEDKKNIMNDQIIIIKKYISETENTIYSIKQKIEPLKSKKNKLKKILILKTQIESNKNQNMSNIEFLRTHDQCPTCHQTIQSSFKDAELHIHLHKNEELIIGLNSLTTQLTSLENDIIIIENLNKEIESLNNDLSSYMTKLSILNSNVNEIDITIEKLETSNINIIHSQKDLLKIEKDIEVLDSTRKSLLNERLMIETAILLLKDGGIKTNIIKQYIPIINKMINKYLSQMDFFVNFNIDENFNEIIKSRFRDDFSYHSFSEGEKFRIDIALLLTWRNIAKMRNSVNCNILLLDEIFDGSLDSNGIDEFLKIMNDLDKNINVFIISHKTDQLIDKFTRVLEFNKIRNFSILK